MLLEIFTIQYIRVKFLVIVENSLYETESMVANCVYRQRNGDYRKKNAAPQCGHIGGKDNENAYILSFTKKNRLN